MSTTYAEVDGTAIFAASYIVWRSILWYLSDVLLLLTVGFYSLRFGGEQGVFVARSARASVPYRTLHLSPSILNRCHEVELTIAALLV